MKQANEMSIEKGQQQNIRTESFRCHSPEIFCCLGNYIAAEFHDNASSSVSANGDIEVNFWERPGLKGEVNGKECERTSYDATMASDWEFVSMTETVATL